MDRRTTLTWVLAAAASVPLLKQFSWAATQANSPARVPTAKGYGTDPNLMPTYKPGALWPLTFTPQQRLIATQLSDLIIPADVTSPSASTVGVVDFLDEWISAPYELQRQDRKTVIDGFKWLDRESSKRFARYFTTLTKAQQSAICDDICYVPQAKPQFVAAATFFARYRDLTAGGYYTTPEGRKDLKYVGNIPLARFDGPPLEVLRAVGLA